MTGLYYLFLEDNKITNLDPLIEMAKKDAGGEKRFAPFINIYLKGNEVKKPELERLKEFNPRVFD